ncbi:hypothetical protein KY285_010585 [Solanum tuberosum]|nr:hypothetical protein KY289_011129 [Solanum tuberosum]KAH0734878.1 hypothetical protein KY285_010585 [Solanum tuberosum]
MFEGDLPHSKSSESNILAAKESIVIDSLARKREGVIHEEGSSFANAEGGGFAEGHLGYTEPVFDQTSEVRIHPSTDSNDTDEDNVPLKWSMQRRMVPFNTKGKEKVTEETPKIRPFTRKISQKLMGNAMKSTETTTTENRRKRRSREGGLILPTDNVVDVSNEISEDEVVDGDIPQAVTQKGKEKYGRKASKLKPRTASVKKGDSIPKKRGKDTQNKREPSKRKMDTSPVPLKTSEQGPGTRKNKD